MSTVANPLEKIVRDAVAPLNNAVNELREKVAKIATPYVTTGPVYQDSKPFSFARLASLAMGIPTEDAKYEQDACMKLKGLYEKNSSHRFQGTPGVTSWLVPYDSSQFQEMARRTGVDKTVSEINELSQRLKGFSDSQVDHDEIAWHKNRLREKAANSLSDTDGGVLRGFPTLSKDLIEIQRNFDPFSRAGATNVTLPPNGMMQYPKQTGATTSYYEGEARDLTPESQLKFATVDLQAKKQFVRTRMTNDMLRFVTPSIESYLRTDMAMQAAQKKAQMMLDNMSGNKAPKGILSYKQPGTPLTGWSQGVDYLLEYTGAGAGVNGNTLNVEDVFNMTSKMPDGIQNAGNFAFIGRFEMYAVLANRRSASIVTGDGEGQFLFSMMRNINDRASMSINGAKYIGSSLVSRTRTKGSATNLSYLLVGDFSYWLDASFGVAEFLSANATDSDFGADTTSLRMIAYNDGAPRCASAFSLYDQLLIA